MEEDLKEKLKERTLDELLELLILGLEYEKLEKETKRQIGGVVNKYQSLYLTKLCLKPLALAMGI